MNEALLQYAWKTLRFRTDRLFSTDGKQIIVVRTGTQNTDAGPDFLNAEICIEGVVWRGAVEIHVQSKDWRRHKHSTNDAYNSVILHLVYECNDQCPVLANGQSVFEAELKNILDPNLLNSFQKISESEEVLPCAELVKNVSTLHKAQLLSRCAYERMDERVEELRQHYYHAEENWEQLLWIHFLGAFGGSLNKTPFQQLGRNLPIKILQKYADKPAVVEALLFGAAGFLNAKPSPDDYTALLRTEWLHHAHKHALETEPTLNFSFLRLRPANYPTVRLAQIAAYMINFPHLSELLTAPVKFLTQAPQAETAPYWATHYQPGKPSKQTRKFMGQQQIDSVMINALLPVSLFYYRRRGQEAEAEKQLAILEQMDCESNHVVEAYQKFGFPAKTALESQGVLHLQKNYCAVKNCFSCAVGRQIFKTLPPFQFPE